MNKTQVAIIGGGAAGFFTAINLAEQMHNVQIIIYEGSNKLLSKVLISGGGRCNVTNRISDPIALSQNYPRGSSFLKSAFEKFNSKHTQSWFNERGVPLKTENDGRVFPVSDSSKSIYNCFINLATKYDIQIKSSHRLTQIKSENNAYLLAFGNYQTAADVVVLATGSNAAVFKILESLAINTVSMVPSLFTFNAKQHVQKDLSGISVQNAQLNIKEIQNSSQIGPLLITHWGYSGPSILRLSAWFARELFDMNYHFTLVINWLPEHNEQILSENFKEFSVKFPKEKVISWNKNQLPKRLWQSLLEQAEIKEYTNWSEIGKKGINRLVKHLCCYEIKIDKKSTFKEEFVTAGGIDLKEVDNTSFEIKKFPNLYAAGELLDIDAITGGFNFQAAWTAGHIISTHLNNKFHN